jgi:dTDP-4-dehydrorhamnose reductase
MPEHQKVLVTGASGLLGSNLSWRYAYNSECTGWYASRPITIPSVSTERIDLTDHDSVAKALDRIQPDLIVHTAAATDVEWCEQNPENAKAINEDATISLAHKAEEHGAKFVYTSTDSVFDGKTGNYTENDAPAPLNVYARGKVRTEREVAKACPSALIIRSYFYGHSPSGTRSLLEWVIARVLVSDNVPGFTDSYFSPIGVRDFADALDAVLAINTTGLLHLGSRDSVSKYEFARMVMEAYECDMTLLRPIKVDDLGLKADRPRNTSLNVDLLQAYGTGPCPPLLME